MRAPFTLLLVGTSVLVNVSSQAVCNSTSTVYVTLPPSVFTETAVATGTDMVSEGKTSTVYNTVAQIEVYSVAPAAANRTTPVTATNVSPVSSGKLYTGYGPQGWNATTLATITKSPTAAASIQVTFNVTVPSSLQRLKKRDPELETVAVSINDEEVSWEDDSDGLTTTPSTFAIAEKTLLSNLPPLDGNFLRPSPIIPKQGSILEAAVQTPQVEARFLRPFPIIPKRGSILEVVEVTSHVDKKFLRPSPIIPKQGSILEAAVETPHVDRRIIGPLPIIPKQGSILEAAVETPHVDKRIIGPLPIIPKQGSILAEAVETPPAVKRFATQRFMVDSARNSVTDVASTPTQRFSEAYRPLRNTAPLVYPQATITAASTSSRIPASKPVQPSNSNTTSGASSSCNEPAEISVNFDDLPHFDVSEESNEQDIPPIFNPYHKLFFDNHFGYVPPPSDPYPPHTPPQLAVYRASGTATDGSPDAGLVAGGIGAGPRADNSAYWFTPKSAHLGCADGSYTGCVLTIKATFGGAETASNITQPIEVPPCSGFINCSLSHVSFESKFVGLSSLSISAAVHGKPVDYYMDDLKIAWYNNTCAAQLERASSE